MKFDSYEDILEIITKRNRVTRSILLVLGAFLAALVYNSFVVPNNLVYGGVGGLAILANKVTGINITLFIDIVTIGLVILSIITVGFKKTFYTIVGYGVYAIMLNLTLPLAKYCSLTFDSFLLSVIIYAFLSGLGFGIVYRCGFNTGGADSIVLIAQHYFKAPTAKLSTIINGIIILLGAFIFGINKSLYAVVFLRVSNFVSDKVILGSSTSKMIFINTKEINKVEEYLYNSMDVGYTLIESSNGVSNLKKDMIMCVLATDKFYNLKNDLVSIDKHIEIISNDCYTTEGGKINKLINVERNC